MNNIFNEPAEPFTLFSYSDFAILLLINLFIFLLLKRGKFELNKLIKILFVITFMIIIPYISNTIEINNVHKKFEIVDGFNLLYTILKIPIWWTIGIIEYVLLKKAMKNNNSS